MKTWKALTALLCALGLLLSLCACGILKKPAETTPADTLNPDDYNEASETLTEAPTEAAPAHPEDEAILNAPGTVYDPVSGRLGEGVSGTTTGNVFDVSFVGAEFFRTSEDREAVRIYYDVTSNAQWIIGVYDVGMQAVQDGEFLWTVDEERTSPAEVHLRHSEVRPGVTVRLAQEYECSWSGGPIYTEAWYFMRWGDYMLNSLVYDGVESIEPGLYDDSLIAVFDPAELPARPANEVEITPISNPDWLNGVPGEGGCNYDELYLAFDHAEFFTDGDERVIRIYVTYTNNYMDGLSYDSADPDLRVMQDGVELWAYEGEQQVSEDENRMTGLAVGEATLVALEYVLRSDSPVTCEYHEFASSDPEIAAVYPCE